VAFKFPVVYQIFLNKPANTSTGRQGALRCVGTLNALAVWQPSDRHNELIGNLQAHGQHLHEPGGRVQLFVNG
jgi:hypothetical protein